MKILRMLRRAFRRKPEPDADPVVEVSWSFDGGHTWRKATDLPRPNNGFENGYMIFSTKSD